MLASSEEAVRPTCVLPTPPKAPFGLQPALVALGMGGLLVGTKELALTSLLPDMAATRRITIARAGGSLRRNRRRTVCHHATDLQASKRSPYPGVPSRQSQMSTEREQRARIELIAAYRS
jgi:hypothetical protein